MTREDLEELYEERAGILEHMGGIAKGRVRNHCRLAQDYNQRVVR